MDHRRDLVSGWWNSPPVNIKQPLLARSVLRNLRSVCIETRFSSAHFYSINSWSKQRNQKEFGKCYDPDHHGHGHDYRLHVFLNPRAASSNGLRRWLTAIEKLQQRIDHRHLNYCLPQFQKKIPTTENLAQWWWDELNQSATDKHRSDLIGLRLWEREDLWVDLFVDDRSF